MLTGNDILLYEIEINVYEDFHMNKVMSDFTEYPDNSRFYDMKNKKIIGKMKDETKSVSIVEFVELKSQIDSYIKEDKEGDKKAKGINKNIKNMTHEEKKKKRVMKRIKWGTKWKEYKVNLIN